MGQGLEVECWGLKPAGDRVAWMKSTQQPLHVGLLPASRVAAAWSPGELSRAEPEGLEKALGSLS